MAMLPASLTALEGRTIQLNEWSSADAISDLPCSHPTSLRSLLVQGGSDATGQRPLLLAGLSGLPSLAHMYVSAGALALLPALSGVTRLGLAGEASALTPAHLDALAPAQPRMPGLRQHPQGGVGCGGAAADAAPAAPRARGLTASIMPGHGCPGPVRRLRPWAEPRARHWAALARAAAARHAAPPGQPSPPWSLMPSELDLAVLEESSSGKSRVCSGGGSRLCGRSPPHAASPATLAAAARGEQTTPARLPAASDRCPVF